MAVAKTWGWADQSPIPGVASPLSVSFTSRSRTLLGDRARQLAPWEPGWYGSCQCQRPVPERWWLRHHSQLPLGLTGCFFGTDGLVSGAPLCLGGDGSAMLSIKSLATLKVSGVEGSCRSSSRMSLGGESKGTGLNKPLFRVRVNVTVAVALEWPDVGCTPLEPLCSTVLGVGEHPVSLCFLYGTGK